MTSAFSWQNSVSLCPASFCTPRPNMRVTPGISWLLTIAFQSPIMKRTFFFGVVVLEGLVGLHRTIQLQLLQHYWSGLRLGLLWYWMVCLGNEQKSFCHFWDCIQVLHFRLFCWLWWPLHVFFFFSVLFIYLLYNIVLVCQTLTWIHRGCTYSMFSKGFLSTIVDIMVIWVKFTHSSTF